MDILNVDLANDLIGEKINYEVLKSVEKLDANSILSELESERKLEDDSPIDLNTDLKFNYTPDMSPTLVNTSKDTPKFKKSTVFKNSRNRKQETLLTVPESPQRDNLAATLQLSLYGAVSRDNESPTPIEVDLLASWPVPIP